jgi:polar amino acid transport system substrate-binding protein/cystine transport system substrate-binding protein/membrane-bound lytic murein transglycosylase F
MITVAGIVALFGAVYLLPPDTSLAQMKQAGALRACVPTLYPPLVTGKADAPGFDIEFAQAIAKRLDVRLILNTNPAGAATSIRATGMSPARSVRCSRAASRVRHHMILPRYHAAAPADRMGLVAANLPEQLQDQKIGFFAGLVGLDRIALSRFRSTEGAHRDHAQRRSAGRGSAHGPA